MEMQFNGIFVSVREFRANFRLPVKSYRTPLEVRMFATLSINLKRFYARVKYN